MFEVGKTYRTRDGRTARILCTDLKQTDKPLAAIVQQRDGRESVCSFTADGRLSCDGGESRTDLMPPRREFWILKTECEHGMVYSSELMARRAYDTLSESRKIFVPYEVIKVVEADE